MQYKNGEVILPHKLLEQIQEFCSGEMIYIPSKKPVKARWGEQSGAQSMLEKRNQEIYSAYLNGLTAAELAAQYYLSEDRIRRILGHMKKAATERQK